MFRLHFTTYGFCYACLPNSEKGKGFVLRQGSHLAMLNLSSEKYRRLLEIYLVVSARILTLSYAKGGDQTSILKK